mmetsp:Transcript_79278/g.232865  ORF Transcript_79278/g.232865 Transcript_79278/m.232865 type:complete len:718 (-) Transcript_79278:52-2205(-)
MDFITPIVRGRCNLCGYSRNLLVKEMGGSVACNHADRGCGGTFEIVYRGLKRGLPWELENPRCTCDLPALTLSVASIGGSSWTVGADPKWTVQAAKIKIGHASGVPVHEQRLIHKASVLRSGEVLGDLVAEGADTVLELTLVRRPAEQAAWLERVREDAASLRHAPGEIRADAEIVTAAAEQDGSLQLLAAPSLLEDAGYVYGAVRSRSGLEASQLASAPLGWVQTVADAKLALRAAFHLGAPGMVEEVMRSSAVLQADDDERVHLAVEPGISPGDARTLLQRRSREVVLQVLQPSTLVKLSLGQTLLDLSVTAADRGLAQNIQRGLANFLMVGKRSMPVLQSEVLAPDAYALALFLRHKGHLGSADGASEFDSLLPHLRGCTAPSSSECCSLVRACLAHAKQDDARSFFTAGADDSDDCVALLTDAGLPLTVLQGHRLKGELLGKVLAGYAGPAEVLAAVARNQNSLRSLLRATEGDADIGRRPQLLAALELAAQREEEAPGRALLRAFAAPPPEKLPDFRVPLAWLTELRGAIGCSSIAIERLLETLQDTSKDDLGALAHETWRYVDWTESSHAQMLRALGVLNLIGEDSRLRSAEIGGREGELQRLKTEGQLSEALGLLPLIRLEDPAKLCTPGLPQHAVAMLSFQHAREAREQAQQAQQTVQQLQVAMDGMRTDLEKTRRDADDRARKLELKVTSLQSEVERLERRSTSRPGG